MSPFKRKAILVFGVLLVLLLALSSAHASTKYVDSTGKTCTYCHSTIPGLNAAGTSFKTNGYKIVETKPATTTTAAATTTVKPAVKPYRDYAGSEACAVCHKDYYEKWKTTYHSKMVQERDKGILKDSVSKWYTDGTNAGPTIGNATKDPFSILDVKYVIGSKWKQRFLVANPKTGGLQLMNKQMNSVTGTWEPYGQANDWDTQCATCHVTGYRLASYDANKPEATKVYYAEMNVGCEACHGPGSKHIAAGGKGEIFNPADTSKEEQARLCGYCHIRAENDHYKTRQGNPREDFPAPILNYAWKPWDDWTKWYPEEIVIPGVHAEDPLSKAYEGDLKGLFKTDDLAKTMGVYDEAKHHQQYQGFLQSKHSGKLSCSDCHNTHANSLVSGSLKKEPDALCATCHTGKEPGWWKTVMPGTGGTAANLKVRTHTFDADQSRKDEGLTAYGFIPTYYFYNK